MQGDLQQARSVWTGEVAKLRQEVQAAHAELDKAQTRVSCVLEDMISHMHSPKFAQRVTSEYTKVLAELRADVDNLKSRTGMPRKELENAPPVSEKANNLTRIESLSLDPSLLKVSRLFECLLCSE